MGHVQNSPVSTNMILNEFMICHMKVHIVSYNLGPKKFPKSKIHILPIYGQTDSKAAIVNMDANDDFFDKELNLNCFYMHTIFRQKYPKPARVTWWPFCHIVLGC